MLGKSSQENKTQPATNGRTFDAVTDSTGVRCLSCPRQSRVLLIEKHEVSDQNKKAFRSSLRSCGEEISRGCTNAALIRTGLRLT